MDRKKAALEATVALADAIKALGSIPEGHLYARVMPHGISRETFNVLIGTLVKIGVVKRSNHELIWRGLR
jgi:hypothetical protein